MFLKITVDSYEAKTQNVSYEVVSKLAKKKKNFRQKTTSIT